jgi:hypothetical protein
MRALLCLLLVLSGARPSVFPANGKPQVIGAQRCKLCHRATYLAWKATAHRRATERLRAEETSPTCLRCHATGAAALPGVQCEACHGAGEFYWPAEVMMDKAKAREAGLVDPAEATCRTCHGTGFPGHASEFSLPRGVAFNRSVH